MRSTVTRFLREHWLWIAAPWLLFGLAVLAASFLGQEGDAPFVYSLG